MTDAHIPVPPTETPKPTRRSIRLLGDTSPIGLGCWRLTGTHEDNVALISAALDIGITFIDNADVYGLDWGGTHFGACEEALGQVLRSMPGAREKIVLATKGGIIPGVPYNSSSSYLVSACEASLQRLGVDNVDLYQIHRPDFLTHPEEVATALSSLHKRGLIRACGVSNFTPSQTIALKHYLGDILVSSQPEFSAVQLAPLRDGTLDLCMQEKLTPLAWSPLAGGRLATGSGVPVELLQTLDSLAKKHQVSREAMALAFVLHHPSQPIALVGTQQPARLADAMRSLSVSLDRNDLYNIIQASEGQPLP